MNAPEKTLVWHIGWPKTGTTSLQNFCRKNQRVLHEQARILYPMTGLHGSGHSQLSTSLVPARPWNRDIWCELADEFSAAGNWDTALVSAEGLRRADPQRLEEVRALLPGFSRVVVIVYLRQPDHFIESFFIENLKNGAWHGSFGEFVDHCQKAGELDFSRQIGTWQAAFPGCDTVARPFDRAQWPEGDLIKDFFRAIGREEAAGLDCLRPVTEVNRTPNGGVLSLLREVNRRLQTERDRTRPFGFSAVLEDLVKRPIPGDHKVRPEFFSAEVRTGLREKYRPELEKLGVKLGNERAGAAADGTRGLADFDELPAGQRTLLLWHVLETAVLTLDRVCFDLETARQQRDRQSWKLRKLKSERDALKQAHRKLVVTQREMEKHRCKNLKGRLAGLMNWWRRLRRGA